MPEPGSHAYNIRRTRLRAELDETGYPDAHADEEANRRLRGDEPAPSPHKTGARSRGPKGERGGAGDPGAVLVVRSAAVTDNAFMASRLAKDGGNEAPDLLWEGVPDGTEELALLCLDPDAPNGTFLHWFVTGLDPAAGDLDGAGGTPHPNDYGETGYGGPLPPVGDDAHRYVFRLYALPGRYDGPTSATADELREHLDGRALAVGTLTGRYQR